MKVVEYKLSILKTGDMNQINTAMVSRRLKLSDYILGWNLLLYAASYDIPELLKMCLLDKQEFLDEDGNSTFQHMLGPKLKKYKHYPFMQRHIIFWLFKFAKTFEISRMLKDYE